MKPISQNTALVDIIPRPMPVAPSISLTYAPPDGFTHLGKGGKSKSIAVRPGTDDWTAKLLRQN